MAIQAMIKGLEHFNQRGLSMRCLKVLLAVELCHKLTKGVMLVRADQIATFVKLKPEEFEAELEVLCDKRYLHAEVELTGDKGPYYTIGSMGGTVLRNMMNRPPKRIRKK